MQDYDVYVGIPAELFSEMRTVVIAAVEKQYPACEPPELVDGYWSGINEDTLHFNIRSDNERVELLCGELREISEKLFVACCETDYE
jgi:hypothetical protein